MSLIIEDGTRPVGANTFASVEDCDAWHGLRGLTVWPPPPETGEDPQLTAKESALVRAADYLNGLGWTGRRAKGGRVMAWPRVGAVDGDGFEIDADAVPEPVRNANCYLAGLVFGGTDIQPILERGNRVQSESVGSMSTSYFDDAASRDVFSVLADILRGYVPALDAFAGIANNAGRVIIGKVVLG